jgi:hypothetical protein
LRGSWAWSLQHSIKKRLSGISLGVERLRFSSAFSELVNLQNVGEQISSALRASEPFLAGRLGSVESRLIGEWCFRGGRFGRLSHRQAHQNAGVFPVSSSGLTSAASQLFSALLQVDLLAQWQSPYQAALIASGLLGSQMKRCELTELEPWWSDRPWSLALEGKRVLVVHPFEASISRQYHRRHLIFRGNSVLPNFALLTLKPPVTLGGETQVYQSWCEALYELVEKIKVCDFDVALIGCGAYGLPLGAAVKQMGKPAIHMGGALQLLFGIRGRRWEAMPQYAALMNDSWVRPSQDETPLAANKVDGGCYW